MSLDKHVNRLFLVKKFAVKMDSGYILFSFCHENVIKMDLRVFLSSYDDDDGYSNVSQTVFAGFG